MFHLNWYQALFFCTLRGFCTSFCGISGEGEDCASNNSQLDGVSPEPDHLHTFKSPQKFAVIINAYMDRKLIYIFVALSMSQWHFGLDLVEYSNQEKRIVPRLLCDIHNIKYSKEMQADSQKPQLKAT